MAQNNKSYWLIGSCPTTPESPVSPSTAPDSTRCAQQPLEGGGGGGGVISHALARQPPRVAIYPDSSISWVPSTTANTSCSVGRPMELAPARGIVGQIIRPPVSVVQHIPPTHQGQYSGPVRNESVLRDIMTCSVSSTSGLSDRRSPEVPSEPVNYREDIKLDDKALVTIETKDLNKRLKKEGISKARQKEIKSERRTLKNRGYASNCRVSREEEEKRLENRIKVLKDDINKYPPVSELEQEYRQVRSDVKALKCVLNMNISDSDDSLTDIEAQAAAEIKDEPEEYYSTSTDEDEEQED